jgi:hypothetical protein
MCVSKRAHGAFTPCPPPARYCSAACAPSFCPRPQVWTSVVEPAGGMVMTSAGSAFKALAPAVDRAIAETLGWKSGLAQI